MHVLCQRRFKCFVYPAQLFCVSHSIDICTVPQTLPPPLVISKILCSIIESICCEVSFEYSYKWQIGQHKLLKMNSTKNNLLGISRNFQKSSIPNIPCKVYEAFFQKSVDSTQQSCYLNKRISLQIFFLVNIFRTLIAQEAVSYEPVFVDVKNSGQKVCNV